MSFAEECRKISKKFKEIDEKKLEIEK